MIRIQEICPPLKLSGLTSFLVSFDYNPEIVEAIKTVPIYKYHPKERVWEVANSCLTKLLDSLTFYDDMELCLLDEFPKDLNAQEPLTEEEINSFKIKPFPHQIDAINFGLVNPKFLLLDSMGLGKTLEIIYLAETLKKRGLIEHCLIICGINSLKQNWRREIEKFSSESVVVLGAKTTKNGTIKYDTISKRAEQLKNPIDEFFVITNIETLRDKGVIKALSKSKNSFGMIALDEAHKCATKKAQQSTNLLKLEAPYMVAATGTLLTNSPVSCYVPLSWTGRDKATLTDYKHQYCIFQDHQIIGFKNLDFLQEEVDRYSIRRTLEQVRDSMPEKNINVEYIEMSTEHRNFYDAIVNGIKEEADKIDLKSSNLLALTTRLRQASVCPRILTTQDISSSKIERCLELIDELISSGEKVVVLSTFKEPVYELSRAIKEKLPGIKCSVNTGDQPDWEVQDNVTNFQNNGDELIFLGTFGKCSTGITLNAASYLIALDESWGAYENSQAYDRIYRITNTRPANIIILVCMDTIDERVHEVAQKKQALSDFIIDNKSGSLGNMLKQEMQKVIESL